MGEPSRTPPPPRLFVHHDTTHRGLWVVDYGIEPNRAPTSSQPHYISSNTNPSHHTRDTLAPRLLGSSSLCRRHLLSHPIRLCAPTDGTEGLRNPASREPVWVRGNQVFGERSRLTTGIT